MHVALNSANGVWKLERGEASIRPLNRSLKEMEMNLTCTVSSVPATVLIRSCVDAMVVKLYVEGGA